MGIGKIFAGVMLLVVSISIWFMLASPQGALTEIIIQSASARLEFSELVQKFQFIYFILTVGASVGLVIWGTQS